MYEAWLSGSEDVFTLLLHHILCENVSVDYQVHFVSVQCYNAVCDVHCDHYVFRFICVCC